MMQELLLTFQEIRQLQQNNDLIYQRDIFKFSQIRSP